MNQPSDLEVRMLFQIKALKLPKPHTEYMFRGDRKWRFDFAWPDRMIALEVEGGTRRGGRHNRHEGFENDCVKYNTAALDGWRVLRVTSDMVRDGRAVELVKKVLDISVYL